MNQSLIWYKKTDDGIILSFSNGGTMNFQIPAGAPWVVLGIFVVYFLGFIAMYHAFNKEERKTKKLITNLAEADVAIVGLQQDIHEAAFQLGIKGANPLMDNIRQTLMRHQHNTE